MTGHGFRGVASTILHEKGYEDEHIEVQLAHAPKDDVAATYNWAKYLPQRRIHDAGLGGLLGRHLGSGGASSGVGAND